jgi:predicted acylesterase/phospholipase RssA
MSGRGTTKKILSSLLGADSIEAIYDAEQRVACGLNPLFREHAKRLSGFKNRHRGKRAIIIGNGPSLLKTNLKLLKNEVTFGLNRIYLLFKKLGFQPTYYVAVNGHVIEQCAGDIKKISSTKFIRWEHNKLFKGIADTVFIRSRATPGFYKNPPKDGLWEGGTVTYAAMQLAFYMGFDEIVLVGVDHSFKAKGAPNELVVSKGDDPDHFDPAYFGKGFRWQLPDLETSERAYRLAKKAFEADGRRIADATVNGKLNIFPKARLEDILSART